MLSQQLEQAFRSRADTMETIEPASTVDAVTGAALDSGFDLGSLGLDSDATALPQLAKADAQADAKADDNLLDFDLGGLSFEPVAATGTANAVHDDATAVPDLQFDMEPFAPLEAPAKRARSARQRLPASSDSLDDLAFDMNFDAPATVQPEQSPVVRRGRCLRARPVEERPEHRHRHGRPGARIRPDAAAGSRPRPRRPT